MSSPPRPAERAAHAERAARVVWRIGFWLPLALCTWLALTPSPPDAVFRVSDVVLHALAFSYLTFALGLAHGGLRYLLVAVLMLLYGVFIEVAQSFQPARSPEVKDLLVDVAGIALGLVALLVLGDWSRRILRRVLAALGLG
jgi:VanZ family protein